MHFALLCWMSDVNYVDIFIMSRIYKKLEVIMIADNRKIQKEQTRNKPFHFFALLFLIVAGSFFFFSSGAHAAFSDTRTTWSNFTTGGGYTAPYTYLGQPIADHETSSDPTHGSASVPPAATDLASASPGAPPGPEDTPSYGYYDGGTPYDPLDPSSMEDDYLFFRMRVRGDPKSGTQAAKTDFKSYHWNVLLDIDDDGYKEYWIDLEGSYASGNNQYDRLQILYNNDNTQNISDPAAAQVEQFTAYNVADAGNLSHSLVTTIPDSSGDYWIDMQIPLTALNDENSNQVVYPNSPVGFVFSTGASNQDPLQKDWMMDLHFLSSSDPITFGDIVILNGEPKLEFVDTALEKVSFYTVGDNIYTYVKYPAGNTGSTTNESITVTVTNPSSGDDEQLTLYESGPNSGLFTNNGGATTPVSSDATNGWLPYVTTSSTTDSATWTLQYDNPSGTWLVYKGAVQQTTYPAATTGTQYTSDGGEVTFTLYDLTPAHGDTITFTTYPADPLPSVADDLSYNNSDNDHASPGGGLEVVSGDTIQFSYTTPSVKTYTTQTNIVGPGVPFIEFTRATGLPSENFQLTNDSATSDQLYVTVTHPLSNANPLVAETISVRLTGNDDETITLTETGPNTGIFRNTTGLLTQVSDGTETTNDSLWEDIDEGTVTATYTYGGTPYPTTTQLFYVNGAGRVNFTNAAGTEDVELYVAGQTVYITVEDKNNTGSSSVTVNVDSLTSGDNETVTLYETSAGSGVFTNGVHNNTPTDLVTTSASAVVTSASSTFVTDGVLTGDTFIIFSGADAGEYTVASVDSETQITLTTTLSTTNTSIIFTTEQLLKAATLSGGTTDDDGTLELVHDETLQVSYTDSVAANGSDDGDSNSSNDIKTDTATYKAPPVLINEVYFYPSTDATDAETEYFQVYNASGASIDIASYTVSDEDGFTYTFPDDAPDETGGFTLDPGEKAYILLYATDFSHNNYYDSGSDTNYLFAVSGDLGGPSDQFGDPDDATANERADQLILRDDSGVTLDYVGWSYVLEPSLDFLGDDSPAVTQNIWQDDAFLDVLSNPSAITEGTAIGRISDGYDTDKASDWTYPVDGSALFDPDGVLFTPVIISSFEAFDDNGRVLLRWETGFEKGTVGFYLFRKEKGQLIYELVNEKLIPGLIISPQGGHYQFYDEGARVGKTYAYLLEEVVETGERIEYGPFTVNSHKRHNGKRLNGSFSRTPRTTVAASFNRKQLKQRTKKSHRKSLSEYSAASNKNSRLNNKSNRSNRPDALKISITEPGFYYIDAAEIADLFSLDLRDVKRHIKNTNLELSIQGQVIPYFADKKNLGIYFYGFAHSDVYTNTNVFWLSLKHGRKMKLTETRRGKALLSDKSFLDVKHFEEDIWAITSQPWEITDDYWIWNYALSGYEGMDSMEFNFQTHGVNASADTASIMVHLVGGSMDGAGVDHRAQVSLNDSWIGECSWKGIDLLDCELKFPQDLLHDGENLLEIQGFLVGDAGFSLFYVDSFDVSYNRYYTAVENSLHFTGDANKKIAISNFDTDRIHLLDVTDPFQPQLIKKTGVAGNPEFGFHISFRPMSPVAEYLAVAATAAKSPDEIMPYTYSDLKKRLNWVDYLIISPAELIDATRELAYYRERQGHSVKTVALEQVINEFNDGLYSPLAIKKFLAHTVSNWRKAPEYVVLVGDATYDYKDVQGFGGNLLPTIFVPTAHGFTASDTYLADVDDDNVPDMAIGRLPVLTADELSGIIEKIKNYENVSGSWKDTILLLADIPEEGADFTSDSNRISREIPNAYSLEKIYLSDYPLDSARQKLFAALHEGAALVNYFGHAGTDRITQNGLLKSTDVETLVSDNGLPIVTAMTCALGEFTFPAFDTLGELLVVQPDGGATAVWSASGLSENNEARLLDSEFYMALYRDGETTLGRAINKAFYAYSLKGEEPYHIYMYNLLGDPALKVN